MSIADPNKIAVGDMVRVKGIVGPKMLVIGIKDGKVQTTWFTKRWEVMSSVFGAVELFKCPSREPTAKELADAE